MWEPVWSWGEAVKFGEGDGATRAGMEQVEVWTVPTRQAPPTGQAELYSSRLETTFSRVELWMMQLDLCL